MNYLSSGLALLCFVAVNAGADEGAHTDVGRGVYNVAQDVVQGIQKVPANMVKSAQLFHKGILVACLRDSLYSRRAQAGQISKLAKIASNVCAPYDLNRMNALISECDQVKKSIPNGELMDFTQVRALVAKNAGSSKGANMLKALAAPTRTCLSTGTKVQAAVLAGGNVSLEVGLCQASNGQNWLELTPGGGFNSGLGGGATVTLSKETRAALYNTFGMGSYVGDLSVNQHGGLILSELISDEQGHVVGFGVGPALGLIGGVTLKAHFPVLPLLPDNGLLLKESFPECI